DGLQVGLVLDQLLGPAMKQADMRIDTLHEFAVKLENHAQNAVCGGMLRSEIDREIPVLRRLRGRARRRAPHVHSPVSHPPPLLKPSFACSQPFGAAFAFSSPGRSYCAPSQGLRKSKLLNSCGSFTGSYTTRFCSSSYRTSTKPVSGKSFRSGWPL